MEFIYNIMETLLPFTWVQYDFMKNALLAVLLITPLLGMLGTMAVNHNMAFFSDALGHSALTGIAEYFWLLSLQKSAPPELLPPIRLSAFFHRLP